MLRFCDVVRKIANASAAVIRRWPMTTPTAWSMTEREASDARSCSVRATWPASLMAIDSAPEAFCAKSHPPDPAPAQPRPSGPDSAGRTGRYLARIRLLRALCSTSARPSASSTGGT